MNGEQVKVMESSAELEQRIAGERDAAAVRRLSGLRLYRLMLLRGSEDAAADVARAMRVKVAMVRKWLRAYSEGGLGGLLRVGRTSRGKPRDRSAEESPKATEVGTSDRPEPARDSSKIDRDRRRINMDKILASVSDSTRALRTLGAKPFAPGRPPVKPDRDSGTSMPETVSRPTVSSKVDMTGLDGSTSYAGAATLAPDSDSSRRPDPRGHAETQRSFEGIRIIVADTDKMIRSIIRHRLEREGADVVEAADGMEAASVVQSGGFDLAVISASLPGLDGFELTTWLGELPDSRYLPVMMMEWPGDPAVMSRSFEIGADDFLRKPFSPVEMLARLRRLLPRRGNRQEGDSP